MDVFGIKFNTEVAKDTSAKEAKYNKDVVNNILNRPKKMEVLK